jgi:hypothetical protein
MRTSSSYKVPRPTPASAPRIKPLGPTKVSGENGDSPPIHTFKTFSTNAIVADFTGFNAVKSDVIDIISTNFENVEVVHFLKQGKAAEITFSTSEAALQAIEKGLYFQNCSIPLTRSFSASQDIVGITVKNLPGRPKEETYEELQKVFGKYGLVQEIKLHFYGDTKIRMPSCAVILDITNMEEGVNALPRQVYLFKKKVDLFWKHAPPFCSYCKCEDHYIQTCPTLAEKKALNQHHEASNDTKETININPAVELPVSVQNVPNVINLDRKTAPVIVDNMTTKLKAKVSSKRLAPNYLSNTKKHFLKNSLLTSKNSSIIFDSIDIENKPIKTQSINDINIAKANKIFDLSITPDYSTSTEEDMNEDLDESSSAF